MKKQHFIFLGKPGLIYYSWMFVTLFISLIIFYENTRGISWPAVIILVAFFVILIYTILTSYWDADCLRLPFKVKTKMPTQPELIKQTWKFQVYKINLNQYHSYYLLRFSFKNK